ncbi:MAG: pro-sigmaK processing inhibitor BofA family protein [Acholeplasmatales bacterium]|nr:pro-sigmaK processing inhibitor BofA family protein [Acholeplasmatales bacterium]
MFNNIFLILKKFIMSILFIYAYNKLSLPLNIIIPMNLCTILLVMLGGIPSIIFLVLFSFLCI